MKIFFLLLFTFLTHVSFTQTVEPPKKLPPPNRFEPIELLDTLHCDFTWKMNKDTFLTENIPFQKTIKFGDSGNPENALVAFVILKDTLSFKANNNNINPSNILIKYMKYTITIKGDMMTLKWADGPDVLKLKMIIKNKELEKLVDLNTGQEFVVTEDYLAQPTVAY